MIKCEHGNLEVEGTMVDLLSEYSAITKNLKSCFLKMLKKL